MGFYSLKISCDWRTRRLQGVESVRHEVESGYYDGEALVRRLQQQEKNGVYVHSLIFLCSVWSDSHGHTQIWKSTKKVIAMFDQYARIAPLVWGCPLAIGSAMGFFYLLGLQSRFAMTVPPDSLYSLLIDPIPMMASYSPYAIETRTTDKPLTAKKRLVRR